MKEAKHEKNNKLIIAAAGSGKTTHLVNEALKNTSRNTLITTFTQANEKEIIKKIYKLNQCVPDNITVLTWFTFLLRHGIRPYQKCVIDDRVKGLVWVNSQSGVKYYRYGIPITYKEEEIEKFYFDKNFNIYSDKLSMFACKCNKESNNLVIDRISRIFSYIFIDEVQDLAGYDLEFLKLLFNSKSKVLIVGDPRQVTYHTHYGKKHKKYRDGNIKAFIEDNCNNFKCEIDEESLNSSHRNNEAICRLSSKLYPSYKPCKSGQHKKTGHDGVFLVKPCDVNKYLERYKPMQLRYNKKTKVNDNYDVINIGESKGATYDRVLLYPTEGFKKWLKNHEHDLKPVSRSKFYVAITRARYSVAIIYDFNEETNIDGITKFSM